MAPVVVAQYRLDDEDRTYLWEVVRTDEGWRLDYTHFTSFGSQVGPDASGVFKQGKALAKFVRQKAAEKMKKLSPAVIVEDTLYKVIGRSVDSVVPVCYIAVDELGGGRDIPECRGCPFRTRCGEVPLQAKYDPNETEESVMQRVRGKMRDKYGAKTKA